LFATSPAEVERRERIALLNLVADKTTRAVVVTDRNLRVVYTNAAFSGMFGYSAEEAQGRQANELVAGRLTDRKTLLRLRRRICDGRGDGEEVLAYDKNGDEIWVSATVKAFRNDRGRIKYIFALLSDISEKQATEVAAATDHGRAGRRASDHRDCRPAVPARRSHCARCRRFGAARRFRRAGCTRWVAQPA
jgi:PAS domain S-box-containing protein